MTLSVERIEKNICICQELKTRKTYEYHLGELPKEAKENDIITGEPGNFVIDSCATGERKKSALSALSKLIEKKAMK